MQSQKHGTYNVSFITGPEHDMGYLNMLMFVFSAYTDVKVECSRYHPRQGREVTENDSLPPRSVVWLGI